MESKMIIAIDGPGAAGKSTVAKLVAKKLNYTYIDTGAMYRTLALYALENNIDVNDEKGLVNALNKISITFNEKNNVCLNGKDVSKEIRSNEVTHIASPISRPRKVREILVKKQQELADNSQSGIVMDGRDIGTVVLPNANVKIYQEASVDVRAKRRYEENLAKGLESDFETIKKEIIDRDYSDTHKEYGSLMKTEDSIVLDTSNMSIDEVVDFIIKVVKERM